MYIFCREIVYSSCTTNVKIPRIFLESLAPGLKIEKPVIDAWADLLNFDERYKSTGSPSRYESLEKEDFITAEDRFYKFEECIRLCDYDTKRMLNSDKMFHLIRRDSIFRNVEPERLKMKWRTCENEFDNARILLSENNSYKDEFQKEVDKVRSIDKNRRRELIEEAVMRRPAKVDEFFGY
ncbi:hypothetical protein Tco_1431404 [Tanacetum coccineum]